MSARGLKTGGFCRLWEEIEKLRGFESAYGKVCGFSSQVRQSLDESHDFWVKLINIWTTIVFGLIRKTLHWNDFSVVSRQ